MKITLPDVLVLAEAPLFGYVPIKHMAPSNFGLFVDKLVVPARVSGKIE
jgi:hypothetical protein